MLNALAFVEGLRYNRNTVGRFADQRPMRELASAPLGRADGVSRTWLDIISSLVALPLGCARSFVLAMGLSACWRGGAEALRFVYGATGKGVLA